jgi:hypothetical protein
MSDSEQIELMREVRDLLRVIAEPSLAKRDAAARKVVLKAVGTSKGRADAALKMDGTRSQSEIRRDTKIDSANLSRLVKALREGGVLGPDEKRPRLKVWIPPDMFDRAEESGE